MHTQQGNSVIDELTVLTSMPAMSGSHHSCRCDCPHVSAVAHHVGTLPLIPTLYAVQVCNMPFVCSKCGAETERGFGNDARYTPPTACSTEGCRSRNFSPLYKAARCLNWQQVRLQVLSRPQIALLAWTGLIWALKSVLLYMHGIRVI